MERILVPKNEEELKNEPIKLTKPESEKLVEDKEAIIKFLKKAKFSYQIELSKWTFRGKEELLYRSMDTVEELIKSVDTMDKAMMNYRDDQAKKREESKQNKNT